ncbi:DNA-binding NarL/FixJ family response regulator [Rhodoblastus acidophilus]|uniref:LuxR C-terminal-related transcriptional regulator n=1 Tax=Rhodoblastus acidophilus TaxID=1074 RepID=UPI00222438CF|nr:response regulator transcription factor [Rhodoblastus acidophilus]MCW2285380.1 DNA-binding NarL/FixJ family response regulator [Rhodoblastus acidophilus]MCW2334372.1 DNA-binding NarL/FixJ family response regulator [Rhodoblastus acidophilus]
MASLYLPENFRALQNPPRQDSSDQDAVSSPGQASEKLTQHPLVIVIERNIFLRACIVRSISHHVADHVKAYSSLAELAEQDIQSPCTVALLSTLHLSAEEADAEFAILTNLGSRLRTMVLAKTDDLNDTLHALSQGANGFISVNVDFDVLIQALGFVAAGGTYVPAQCLLAARANPSPPAETQAANAITSREKAVIKAIREGKSNKVIAYELNMCESTVKVHVRHIMKKLHAKNRTELAIKSMDL